MDEKINYMLKQRDKMGCAIIEYMKEDNFIKDLEPKAITLINKLSELLAYDDDILNVMATKINMNSQEGK